MRGGRSSALLRSSMRLVHQVLLAYGVRAEPATRVACGRRGRLRRVKVLRIGNPSLECSPRPGTGPPAHVTGRRKPFRQDSPLERHALQRRDPEDVPDAVEGQDHAGITPGLPDDPSVRVQRRICGGGLRRAFVD